MSLFPELPDAVGLQVVVRLGFRDRFVAQAVSRRWRDALRSRELYEDRVKEGLLEPHLFACFATPVFTEVPLCLYAKLFNPTSLTWLDLPPLQLPNDYHFFLGYTCISHGANIFIIGGLVTLGDQRGVSSVWIFDSLRGNWEQGLPTNNSQAFSVANIVDEHLYVADPHFNVEMLNLSGSNVKANGWVCIEKPNVAQGECEGSFVKDGKLCLVREAELAQLGLQPELNLYDPSKAVWVKQTSSFLDSTETATLSFQASFANIGDHVYGVFYRGLENDQTERTIRRLDESEKKNGKIWRVVAEPSDRRILGSVNLQLVAVGERRLAVVYSRRNDPNGRNFMSGLGLREGEGEGGGDPLWEFQHELVQTFPCSNSCVQVVATEFAV